MTDRFRQKLKEKAQYLFTDTLIKSASGYLYVKELSSLSDEKDRLRLLREKRQELRRKGVDFIQSVQDNPQDLNKLSLELVRAYGHEETIKKFEEKARAVESEREELDLLINISDKAGDDYALAIEQLTAYVDQHSDSYRATSFLAGRLAVTMRYSESIQMYRRAKLLCVDFAFKEAITDWHIAGVLANKGESELAIAQYIQLTRRTGLCIEIIVEMAYQSLAELYDKLGASERSESRVDAINQT